MVYLWLPQPFYNTFLYNTVLDPIWSFKTDFPIITFYSWIANNEIGLDPNNSVIYIEVVVYFYLKNVLLLKDFLIHGILKYIL